MTMIMITRAGPGHFVLVALNPQIEEDFSNYDDSQAWPSLLDSFVDWIKEGQ